MGVPYSEDCCDNVEIAAKVEWSGILNVPSYITTDWSVDQGDTNIDANNIPLLSYAPNTLAANGTPGLSNFNFNQTRKQKLDTIANAAQVNVQANWDETDNTRQATHTFTASQRSSQVLTMICRIHQRSSQVLTMILTTNPHYSRVLTRICRMYQRI